MEASRAAMFWRRDFPTTTVSKRPVESFMRPWADRFPIALNAGPLHECHGLCRLPELQNIKRVAITTI